MDDIKQKEFERACKKEKDHKVRARLVTVRMCGCSTCQWRRLPASRYVVSHGP